MNLEMKSINHVIIDVTYYIAHNYYTVHLLYYVFIYKYNFQDILYDAFNEISSDKYALNLTDFICGLIKFGINSLSNKEMENIFNLMDTDNQNTITAIDFINFLTNDNQKYDETNNNKNLQFIILNEIYEIYENNKNKRCHNDNIDNHRLCISDYFEFSYNPIKSTQTIFDEYKFEIKNLKLKLKEAIMTLKETVNSNAEHIGKHQQVITQLKYSIFQQQTEEHQQECQEILIESSLEPQTDYNPLEWNINDCLDWLQMIELSQYTEIFKINNINGNILLNEIYHWKNQQFIDILKFNNNQDIDKFIHELHILKQTAPEIYDPNTILSLCSSARTSRTSTATTDTYQEVPDDDQYQYQYQYQLQEIQNVTSHSFIPNITNITNKINEINKIKEIEINKLKSELNRIISSKLALIVNTSSELQKLRDIIKKYKCNKCENFVSIVL